MAIRPMLSSLRRHKLTVCLLTLQVAFTCAIVCNATFLIVHRIGRIIVPSGVGENTLSVVTFVDPGVGDNALAIHKADLDALRRLSGVQSAALVSNVPLTGDQMSSGVCASLEAVEAARKAQSTKVSGCLVPDIYLGGPDSVRTMGLHLVAGRDFRAGEYVTGKGPFAGTHVPAVIVSRALASRLYPDTRAVGQMIYVGPDGLSGDASRIVGVVAHLQRGALVKGVVSDASVLLPIERSIPWVHFALHSKPQDRERILKAAVAVLDKMVPGRKLAMDDAKTYAQIRADYFQRDTAMIGMLLAAALGLLFVTALGIGGLASFWVGQRTRTIGIRRAVGATRSDILRYFQVENFLIVTGGVVLGVTLAMGLSLLLMQHYELPRLPLWYLPVGAAMLWLLGQLSVLSPAVRASRVPPVVATRSV